MSESIADLADLTAPFFALRAAFNPVILLPLGSHEDHGPHMPMGDFRLAELLGRKVAAAATQLGTETYVAPCLPFGVADYFGASPGGLALTAATFRSVLVDLLEGLRRHGLTRIVILNGHGGNVPIIHELALQYRLSYNQLIPSFYLWRAARELMQAQLGPAASGRFGHGAEPLQSLSLALRPVAAAEATKPDDDPGHFLNLPVTGFGTVTFEGISIEVPVEFDQVPRDAQEEAWPQASAALGAAVANALVGTAARFVRHFSQVTGAVSL